MTEYFTINDINEVELDAERQRTLAKLGEIVPQDSFFEVGSTAVPGVIGKQDLDFLVRVSKARFANTRSVLDTVFQRNSNQLSTDIYQGYTVKSDMDVAIQLTIEGGPHDTFLEFLERLRKSADLRTRYNDLKRKYDGKPMDDYRNEKRAFIEAAIIETAIDS